jgi:hypothetical protein
MYVNELHLTSIRPLESIESPGLLTSEISEKIFVSFNLGLIFSLPYVEVI